MRNDANRALTITSGGRCSYHPNEVNRVKKADHQNLVAVDIAISSLKEATELAVLAGRYGATAVAISLELGFIHCAWREVDDNRVRVWSY